MDPGLEKDIAARDRLMSSPIAQRFRLRLARDLTRCLAALVTAGIVIAGAIPAAAQSTRDMQWYLDAMQAENMWKISKGNGITIALLDSEVDRTVPELRGQLTGGKNFVNAEGSYADTDGHGTTMASLMVGTGNDAGIQGLAPEAKVIPMTVIAAGHGIGDQARAIDYAVDNGADIINMSFGSPSRPDKELRKAVDRANRKGVLVIASAGNEGGDRNQPVYPAALTGVVAVGAGDKNGKATEFSSHGSYLALSAPGDEMAGRCGQESKICKKRGGTSAASALASASAALIWSKYPNWTANQVLRVMLETAGRKADADGPSKYVGYGAVRPRVALVDEKIAPGAAEKNPLFSKYNEKSREEIGGSPSQPQPSPTAEPQASDSVHEERSDKASPEDGDNGQVRKFILAGVVIALIAGACWSFLTVYRKSRTR